MAKRFPHQTARSYRTSTWDYNGSLKNYVKSSEVMTHVLNTCRCDADPIFNELAHRAAVNGLRHGYTGQQGVSFTQPTVKPRGYYSILKYIVEHPQSSKRDIDTHFGAKILTTVDRLCAGGLISGEMLRSKTTNRMVTHFTATPLGKSYALAAARYLVQRS